MKPLLVVLTFLLLLTPVLSLESDYDYLITTGEEIQLADGTLYVLYPTTITEEELFQIELLFYPDLSGGVFSLYRDDALLMPQTQGSEQGEEAVYFYLTWADSLRQPASYTLQYQRDSELSYTKEFLITTQPKEVTLIEQKQFTIVDNAVTQDMLALTYSLLQNLNYAVESYEAIMAAHDVAVDTTTITKTAIVQEKFFVDGTAREETKITISIQPSEPLSSLTIIEHIPKEFTSKSSYLFADEQFTTLQEDPVIMWHLENVDQPVERTYIIDKSTDVTGNTVLLAQTAEVKTSYINWKLVGPLALIPIVALFLIYFETFSPRKAGKQKKPTKKN